MKDLLLLLRYIEAIKQDRGLKGKAGTIRAAKEGYDMIEFAKARVERDRPLEDVLNSKEIPIIPYKKILTDYLNAISDRVSTINRLSSMLSNYVMICKDVYGIHPDSLRNPVEKCFIEEDGEFSIILRKNPNYS